MKTLQELSDKFFDNLTLKNADGTSKSDSDKVCFNNALEKFLSTGSKEDAFVVYFCFSEIFKLFGKGYGNTQKLLEMLSDHEYHSGELLSKHRDHYSHSVYVFALGLAIFANDKHFRGEFCKFYNLKEEDSAFTFLYMWGLTSLFHDIGYPFQLAHEQIKNYVAELWKNSSEYNPYVSFGNFDKFVLLTEEQSNKIKQLLNVEINFKTFDEVLAYGLKVREGYNSKAVTKKLRERIIVQPNFMDHGYFSAIIMAKQLFSMPEFVFNQDKLDILTAILLHNNFNKFDAPDSHPIGLDEHPLAYLLILCDELQSWDRLAYGKDSKKDPIAWDVTLNIRENDISLVYYFESSTVVFFDEETKKEKKRLNKSFLEIQENIFVEKIKKLIKSPLVLKAEVEEKEKTKKTRIYASDNNFINLCDFANAIHASYSKFCENNDLDNDSLDKNFDNLSLEFKVSNIEQAKSYAYKLELINCFYSSKDLDYPVVEDFRAQKVGTPAGQDNLGFLCREEHVRWVQEKLKNGWKYGREGVDYNSLEERNKKKLHKDIVPYECLSPIERKKDELMVNNIIPMLKRFGHNIRIYSYRNGRKPDLEIGGIGHRFFTEDKENLKYLIKQILLKYSKNYRVIVRTCYAYGADQLIAECAIELGLTTKAVIPTDYENYIQVVKNDCIASGHDFTEEDEYRMRHLLAQTVVCHTMTDSEFFYRASSGYVVTHCQKLIALWDGQELPLYDKNNNEINRGGTYDGICIAKERGLRMDKDIKIINCHRPIQKNK